MFSVFAFIFSMCEKDEVVKIKGDLPLNQEIVIQNNSSLTNEAEDITLKMEGVISDSRCPTEVECVWEGDAEVKFTFTSGTLNHTINLHTTLTPKDTTVGGFSIALKKLDPHPVTTNEIPQSAYKATVLVTKKK